MHQVPSCWSLCRFFGWASVLGLRRVFADSLPRVLSLCSAESLARVLPSGSVDSSHPFFAPILCRLHDGGFFAIFWLSFIARDFEAKSRTRRAWQPHMLLVCDAFPFYITNPASTPPPACGLPSLDVGQKNISQYVITLDVFIRCRNLHV